MNTQPIETQKPEFYQDPDEEGHMIENADLGALVQINASEISQQILTARAYPRSITGFRKQMFEMATLDQEVAQSCIYALKRGGKVIEGPSARFAEIAAQTWGNCRAGARVIDIGEQFITAQGMFFDLEKNMAVAYEVLRRITDRDGKRYGDDMISVTGNAACAIAIRNAVLKGIPKAFWNSAYMAARTTVAGDVKAFSARRVEMLKSFAQWGIEPAQIYALLEVEGADDVNTNHLVLLGGIHTSIKDGEVTPEEAFAVDPNKKSGVATPRRPTKSEFERKPDPKKEEAKAAETKKPEAQQQAQPQPQQQTTPQQRAEPEREQVQETEPEQTVEEEGDLAGNAKAQLAEWLTNMQANIAKQTRIKDLGELRELVADQIDGEELKRWHAACDARQTEILEATRKKK